MRRPVTLLASLLALPAAQGSAQPPAPLPLQVFTVDAGHSIAEFSIGFAFTRVKGRFTQTHGTILYDRTDPARSSVTVILETKSIDTGWPHRDEHLRTSDFFDVERYPTITFRSERLRRVGDGWVAEGPLTMHGVTKTIAIPFRLAQPPVRDPQSRWVMLDVVGTARLARKDFGILGGSTFNSWFTTARSATMADTVDVSLEVEGYRVDETSQRPPPIEAALERARTDGVEAYVARLRDSSKTKPPERWQAYYVGQDLVVRALVATGRLPEAVTLSRALTELFPASASARLLHGYVLAVAGDARSAGEQYLKGREVFRPKPEDPNEKFEQVDENWYWLDLLARTAVETGHGAEAVGLARAITALYPATADAFVTCGYALAAVGDTRGAAEQYAKALELDPMATRALELRRRL